MVTVAVVQNRSMASLGASGLADITRQLCLELGVKQPESLAAAVRKLKGAVEAMPAMEGFIQRVVDLVTSVQSDRLAAGLTSSRALPVEGHSTMLAWSHDVLHECILEMQLWSRELRERTNSKVRVSPSAVRGHLLVPHCMCA
jgi:hypothetical protein